MVFRERCKLNQPADLWGASGPSSVSEEHATIVTRGSCMHACAARCDKGPHPHPHLPTRPCPSRTSPLQRLPDDVKASCEDPPSFYNLGWSHGKEMFAGREDTAKGSYYGNPLLDVPSSNAEDVERYPSYCRPNLWPRNALPALEPAFKELGQVWAVHVRVCAWIFV